MQLMSRIHTTTSAVPFHASRATHGHAMADTPQADRWLARCDAPDVGLISRRSPLHLERLGLHEHGGINQDVRID